MLDMVDKISVDTKLDKPEETYAIGLYEGKSPFDLKPSTLAKNPILCRRDFTHENVNFIADPFALFDNGTWYLFYEVINVGSRKGEIYVSTSDDKYSWTKGVKALEESFHLSYPQVFKNGDDFYMIPESYESNQVRLYKAEQFPNKWKFEKVLLELPSVDTTVYLQDDTWWMFACDTPHDHNRLRLFYADNLYGDWQEHPKSPICEDDVRNSRPAGKLLEYQDKLYRFSQDCEQFYGHSVRVFEIEKMDLLEYKERELDENPILKGDGETWNRVSMHHIDLHKIEENHWLAFVDGRSH